ncbi:Imidazolonepropionase [Candidatus Izimaplasma bacterium HR1]|jgi:imidazolonepropionase|uniref:imidazolonepropionase n=1 Tax=Candidatus Izimoplasma sp. HR1 TaxID=1541959 RepID=UPI0004F7E010|nr:Imidazolonepropionase [Candidatus Izimaplasma bacterium HR1]
MVADTIIYNIKEIITPHRSLAHRGKEMRQLESVKDAFIAIRKGKIIDYGKGNHSKYLSDTTYLHDAHNCIVIPGLIDSHTHLVHGGSREHEFGKKIKGVPYLDILKQGGGILSTVEATRNSDFGTLFQKARKSLDEMLLLGVTTVEAKSGYGLNYETEVKQLEVAKKLNEIHPIDVISTYLGAHAVPTEYKDNKDEYINAVIKDMALIRNNDLAESVDVFCEDSVYNLEDTRKIVEAAKKLGFFVRLHADEIHPMGGLGLAVELNASSADHLIAASNEDIKKLSKSKTVANLLPSTSFYLNKDFANARKMIDEGCIVSLSSDYNPGSSPSENLQFSMQLGCNKMRLRPKEVLTAVTINPAYGLGLKEKVGSIAKGKNADIVIMDASNLEYIMYHFGVNHTKDVFKNGKLVVKDRQII